MRRVHRKKPSIHARLLYEIEVEIINGPVMAEFVRANPRVARTIQIRGDQTLEVLHEAIFDAFDRFDEHLYQFEIGGKKPMDRKAARYVMPEAMDNPFADVPDIDAGQTEIGSLGFKPRQVFFYWFDFGDDWWHKLKVLNVHEDAPPGEFPIVTARVGQSPPQYPGLDDEDDESDEEDDDAEK